jgi:hypothetical protein
MTTAMPMPDRRPWLETHRRSIRYLAAALSAGCALVYFLIGFGLVYEEPADGTSLIYFGVPAGLSFVLGAALLLAADRRSLWVLGAIYQVFVILAYFGVAERRDPPFEPVGILLKVAQLAILGLLLALLLRPATTGTTAERESRPGSSADEL